MRAAMEGMLRPEEREVILGEAVVREVFKISRLGTIAGCAPPPPALLPFPAPAGTSAALMSRVAPPDVCCC